jgi:hypothetical protein
LRDPIGGGDTKKPAAGVADVYRFVVGDMNAGGKLSEASLAALRKALKKLEGYPDKAALEAVRKEIQKALDQIQGQAAKRPWVYEWVPRDRFPGTSGFTPFSTVYSAAPLGDGRLGIHVAKPNATLAEQLDLPKGQGLVITAVYHEMPAGKAGLKVNDILLELNTKSVPSDPAALTKLLEGIKADTTVDVVVVRRGRRETIKGMTLAAAQTPYRVSVLANVLRNAPTTLYEKAKANASGGGSGTLTTTFRNADRFTTRYQEGSLIITITGNVGFGKAMPKEIHIQDGGVSNTYGVGNVPDRYRDRVDYLLQSLGQQGNIRIETK